VKKTNGSAATALRRGEFATKKGTRERQHGGTPLAGGTRAVPMKLSLAACLIPLALALGACGGYRQNGESCWSDDQCVSGYCSWGGNCSPGLLELIADWLRDDPEPPPPPPPRTPYPVWPPPPRVFPFCFVMEEKECRATPKCRWIASCSSDFTAQEPDAGMRACGREYFETGLCPNGCLLTGLCA
jgi:hypothetical protein